MNRHAKAAWIFSIAVIILLVAYPTLQDGMFTDGLLYASVSRNLAEGYGSIWNLQFSQTDFPNFSEQPPLGFVLQAGLFKLFGASLYPERIYNLLMAAIAAWGIYTLWNLASEGMKQMAWLPVLAFFIMPVSFWAYPNNVLETTMLNFDLFAVILMWKAFKIDKSILMIIAGIVLAAASLTKGIQGLFPLVFPILYGFFLPENGNRKKVIRYTLLVLAGLLLVYIPLAIYPESRDSIAQYFEARYPKTFGGIHDTTGNRFHLLKELFLDILPALCLLALVLLWTKHYPDKKRIPQASLLLILALSGMLPLMVTLEQRGFYLLTGLPYIAIAFFLPWAGALQEKLITWASGTYFQIFKICSFVLLLFAISFTTIQAGQIKRDKNLLYDVYRIGAFTGSDALIKTSNDLATHWSLKGYLARYFHISAGPYTTRSDWFLQAAGGQNPEGYQEIQLGLKELMLSHKHVSPQP